uniref:Uncharacterized protein n=1 Tax=Arundo donax TaxID=35708 RepID=A0A0A8YMR7_ARUDO
MDIARPPPVSSSLSCGVPPSVPPPRAPLPWAELAQVSVPPNPAIPPPNPC